MTTLEKAARAAWASYPNDDASFDSLTEVQKDTAYNQARAVLLAVREPGLDVASAIFDRLDCGELGEEYDATDVWQSGIDAILKQPPTPPRVDPA